MKEFLLRLWANDGVRLAAVTFVRLVVAAVFGGVIGMERQHSHRPAGIRTHVLVAVGSALVMCTSVYIYQNYYGGAGTNPDLSRLGAQVISGIGFLGAGTILREGFSVKGLTTAASLWAVACIGLTVGVGFWAGALVATVVIYFTLNALKKVAMRYTHIRTIFIGVSDAYHVSEKVAEVFQACGAKMRTLEIVFPEENAPFQNKEISKVLKALAYINAERDLDLLKASVLGIEGVKDFYVET